MKKEVLRQIYKQKRADLSLLEIEKLQQNIYQQIFNLDISDINTVHLFLSLIRFKEINTKPIINFFRAKNKQIVVSKCNFKNHTLSHFYLDENTKLETNKFGVPEPIDAKPALEKDLDLVFVPLLISDTQNFRVGYGKGFYDRFLANCSKDCKKIGLNFFAPIAKIEDIDQFDISLDKIIYPKPLI